MVDLRWGTAQVGCGADGETIETLMAALRDRLSPEDRRFLNTLTGNDRAYVEHVLRTEGPISPVRFSGLREEIEYARNF